MKIASIPATKNQRTALIEQVRHGETILIADHAWPVARLIPVAAENGQSSPHVLACGRQRPLSRKTLFPLKNR